MGNHLLGARPAATTSWGPQASQTPTSASCKWGPVYRRVHGALLLCGQSSDSVQQQCPAWRPSGEGRDGGLGGHFKVGRGPKIREGVL
jgi:hypothetical protein